MTYSKKELVILDIAAAPLFLANDYIPDKDVLKELVRRFDMYQEERDKKLFAEQPNESVAYRTERLRIKRLAEELK